MPDLKDPQKQIPVAPKFFLDPKVEPLPDGLTAAERRELAASYVTGQDNPWFAKAFVNRVWYALMGEGFYNPVDDIGPTATAKAPEVLDALAVAVAEGGLRRPLALPDDPEHADLSARGPLDLHRRRAGPRSPRTARAGSAPTRSSTRSSRPSNLPLDGPGGRRGKGRPRPRRRPGQAT